MRYVIYDDGSHYCEHGNDVPPNVEELEVVGVQEGTTYYRRRSERRRIIIPKELLDA